MNDRTGLEGEFFARRQMRFGWWALLVSLSMGLLLEALHGFKAAFYVDVSSSIRREMWTLAHAHGTLVALINIAFGLTLRAWPEWSVRHAARCSPCLIAAAVLMPAGFFIGGLYIHAGDPGLGIVLVPVGAVLLIYAVAQLALGAPGAVPDPAADDGLENEDDQEDGPSPEEHASPKPPQGKVDSSRPRRKRK